MRKVTELDTLSDRILVTAFPPSSGGSQLTGYWHPFAHSWAQKILHQLDQCALMWSTPRNQSIWIQLLNWLLQTQPISDVLWVHPFDPRDFLALYETRHALGSKPFRIHRMTPVRRDTMVSKPIPFSCQRWESETISDPPMTWRDWEQAMFGKGECPPGPTYRQGLSVWHGHGPPSVSQECSQRPSHQRRHLAVWGEWLLGDELWPVIESAGWDVVFIQTLFDPCQDAGCIQSGESPLFLYQPLSLRMPRYQAVWRSREVHAILSIHASFSTRVVADWGQLRQTGLPFLRLEMPIPGILSAAERNRLESFLH